MSSSKLDLLTLFFVITVAVMIGMLGASYIQRHIDSYLIQIELAAINQQVEKDLAAYAARRDATLAPARAKTARACDDWTRVYIDTGSLVAKQGMNKHCAR